MSFAEAKSGEIPDELLPMARPYLNLQSYRRSIRWTQGSLNASNNRAQIDLPNEDCVSLNGRIRFTAIVTSAAGTNPAPEALGSSFFDRLRLEIGGTKIIDQDHYNLFQGIVAVATDPNEQKGTRAYNAMASAAQMDPVTRETMTSFDYDLPLSLLDDSLLSHHRTLLPLFMLPRTTITLYCASDESATSSVGSKATYEITNLELVLTFYSSPSLRSYFTSVPYSLPHTAVAHRLYTLPSGQSSWDLMVPSNYRSLRSIVAVARGDDVDNRWDVSNKNITFDPIGGAGLKWNLRINGFNLWQESVEGSLFFDQLRRVFGNKTLKSEFFKLGTEFRTDKFILAASLNSLGGNEAYVSGARTNQHVSSVAISITSDVALPAPLQLSVFLLYDQLLQVSSGRMQVIQ